MKLTHLMRKNALLLIKSRASFLVIMLGPLLVIMLAGLAFDNSNAYQIKVGVYMGTPSEDAQTILAKLNTSQFVVKYLNAPQACIDGIYDGSTHACLVIPEGFTFSSNQSQMELYVDDSRIALAYIVRDTLKVSVGERAAEVSQDLTQSLLNIITFSNREAKDRRGLIWRTSLEEDNQSIYTQAIRDELRAMNLSFTADEFRVSELQSKLDTVRKDFNASIGRVRANVDIIRFADDAIVDPDAEADFSKRIQELFTELDYTEYILAYHYGEAESIPQQLARLDARLTALEEAMNEARLNRGRSELQVRAIEVASEQNVGRLWAMNVSNEFIIAQTDNLRVKEADNIVNPFTTNVNAVASSTQLNYVFPVLMTVVIIFLSLILAATQVVAERTSPAAVRNRLLPVRDELFIIAGFLTSSIVVFGQLLIIAGIASIFFNANFLSNLGSVGLVLLLGVAVFLLAGMLIGYLIRKEEFAMLTAISLGSVLLLFSGVFIPIESIPAALQSILQYNPAVLLQDGIREALLFGAPLADVQSVLWPLLAYVWFFGSALYITRIVQKNSERK